MNRLRVDGLNELKEAKLPVPKREHNTKQMHTRARRKSDRERRSESDSSKLDPQKSAEKIACHIKDHVFFIFFEKIHQFSVGWVLRSLAE